jgi:plasmid stabilization system protein ParE
MTPDPAPAAPRYRVEEADLAESDREDAFFWLLSTAGPEYADAWHRGLLQTIQQLAEFPGPRAHPVVRPLTGERPEIRRMLYYGPQGRRSPTQTRYRVLFTVIGPVEGESEGVIRVLRVLHGARQTNTTVETEQTEAETEDGT